MLLLLTHRSEFQSTAVVIVVVHSLSCLTICNPRDCSMPGFPVLHYLPELAQTHFHSVGDAIQPSHPLLSPSLAFNLSEHLGLFQWIGSLHQVIKRSEVQHQSFQWIVRTDFLKDWLIWYPYYSRDSQESSPTPQFKCTDSSVLRLLCGSTLICIHDNWKNHSFDNMNLCWQRNVCFLICCLGLS